MLDWSNDLSSTYKDLVARSKHIRPLRVLPGHDSGKPRDWHLEEMGLGPCVQCAAFAPSGRWLALGASDNVRIWDIAKGCLIYSLKNGSAYDVAFSRNERFLASADSHAITLSEAQTGHTIFKLKGHTRNVYTLASSHDGLYLTSGGKDNMLCLWDMSSGRLLSTLNGHTNWISSVAFSPDGHWLASGSEDHSMRLWEVASGRLVFTFQHDTRAINGVAFSPDGRWLAAGSDDTRVYLWEFPTCQLISTFEGHTGPAGHVAFLPGNRVLISGSIIDGTVRFWDIESRRMIIALPQAESFHWRVPFAVSTDGHMLLAYAPDSKDAIQVWDITCMSLIS